MYLTCVSSKLCGFIGFVKDRISHKFFEDPNSYSPMLLSMHVFCATGEAERAKLALPTYVDVLVISDVRFF